MKPEWTDFGLGVPTVTYMLESSRLSYELRVTCLLLGCFKSMSVHTVRSMVRSSRGLFIEDDNGVVKGFGWEMMT